MHTFIALVAALMPPILLFLYIWMIDPQKEPVKQLLKAFFLGIGICIPVAFIELLIQHLLFGSGDGTMTLLDTTANAFLVAAIPEEAAKLFVLWIVLRKNKYFDEHFDGIVYAVCVGLGFAAIENVFYVLGDEEWLRVAVMRSLLSVPGHYAFAVIMGYCYAVYHFVKPSAKNAVMIFLMPMMAHGIFDALAMSGSADPTIGGIAFFVLIYFCIKMQKIAKNRINRMIARDRQSQEPQNPALK